MTQVLLCLSASGSVSNIETLNVFLDRRNCWEQSINLQVFRDAKDIFLNHLRQVASCKQDFMVEPGAVTPVPLFEFELRELFIEATVKSGCKWWCLLLPVSCVGCSWVGKRTRHCAFQTGERTSNLPGATLQFDPPLYTSAVAPHAPSRAPTSIRLLPPMACSCVQVSGGLR